MHLKLKQKGHAGAEAKFSDRSTEKSWCVTLQALFSSNGTVSPKQDTNLF